MYPKVGRVVTVHCAVQCSWLLWTEGGEDDVAPRLMRNRSLAHGSTLHYSRQLGTKELGTRNCSMHGQRAEAGRRAGGGGLSPPASCLPTYLPTMIPFPSFLVAVTLQSPSLVYMSCSDMIMVLLGNKQLWLKAAQVSDRSVTVQESRYPATQIPRYMQSVATKEGMNALEAGAEGDWNKGKGGR